MAISEKNGQVIGKIEDFFFFGGGGRDETPLWKIAS